MKRIITAIALMMMASSVQADMTCDVPTDEAMSAVVRVVGKGVEGSGVVIDSNRVLTAAHVIEGMDEISIVHKGITRSAAIVSSFPEKDLALLVAETSDQQPIDLSRGWLAPSSTIWAVGFPLGGNQIASSGRIEAYAEGDVQTTASVNHGQSGGGLLGCENGQHVLAGMIRAFGALQEGDRLVRLDDYSVSVPSEDINQFVRSSKVSARIIERFLLGSTDTYQLTSDELVASR